MRAKLIRESILKGPSKEDMLKKINKMNPTELFKKSLDKSFFEGVKRGVQKLEDKNLKDIINYYSAVLFPQLVQNDSYEIIKYLGNKGYIDFDSRITHQGLWDAAEYGYFDIVKYLNEKIGETGEKFSPQDFGVLNAIKNNHIDIMHYLLNNGANIQSVLNNISIMHTDIDILKELAEHYDIKNNHNIKMFIYTAKAKGTKEDVEFLKSKLQDK